MLLDKIQTLLDGPGSGEGAPARRHVEDLLTEGYAYALALEAECLRIERRIRDAAVAGGGAAADELGGLGHRLSTAAQELKELRGKLSTLRAHALA